MQRSGEICCFCCCCWEKVVAWLPPLSKTPTFFCSDMLLFSRHAALDDMQAEDPPGFALSATVLESGLAWLASVASPQPRLSTLSLRSLVEAEFDRHFVPHVLRHRSLNAGRSIVAVANRLLDLIVNFLCVRMPATYDWPAPEFAALSSAAGGIKSHGRASNGGGATGARVDPGALPLAGWNTEEHLAAVRAALESLRLPASGVPEEAELDGGAAIDAWLAYVGSALADSPVPRADVVMLVGRARAAAQLHSQRPAAAATAWGGTAAPVALLPRLLEELVDFQIRHIDETLRVVVGADHEVLTAAGLTHFWAFCRHHMEASAALVVLAPPEAGRAAIPPGSPAGATLARTSVKRSAEEPTELESHGSTQVEVDGDGYLSPEETGRGDQAWAQRSGATPRGKVARRAGADSDPGFGSEATTVVDDGYAADAEDEGNLGAGRGGFGDGGGDLSVTPLMVDALVEEIQRPHYGFSVVAPRGQQARVYLGSVDDLGVASTAPRPASNPLMARLQEERERNAAFEAALEATLGADHFVAEPMDGLSHTSPPSSGRTAGQDVSLATGPTDAKTLLAALRKERRQAEKLDAYLEGMTFARY